MSMSDKSVGRRRAWIVPALIVGAMLVAMSGACSQHEPGSYEGGGRTTQTPQVTGGNTDDSGLPDIVGGPDVGSNDVFVLPETSNSG